MSPQAKEVTTCITARSRTVNGSKVTAERGDIASLASEWAGLLRMADVAVPGGASEVQRFPGRSREVEARGLCT